MSQFDRDHLIYYERELALLREMGAQFATQYPTVANRLSFGPDVSADPHTERLLQSFAFLTSYLKRDIDNQFPRVAETLLSVLQPQLVAPIPPMSIARLTLDPNKGKTTTGYNIPKGFPLFARSKSNDTCKFQTCYDTTLFPFEVMDARIKAMSEFDWRSPTFTPYPFGLHIRLRSTAMPFSHYEMSPLRFYINSDTLMAHALYEALFLSPHRIAVLDDNLKELYITPSTDTIQSVGFEDAQNVLPDFPQSLSSYRLIQEYFAFPKKFLFFDVTDIKVSPDINELSLVIPLASYDDKLPQTILVDQSTIQLGCTPIINLFPKITDPIAFDHKQIAYPLYPDIRRQDITEIHSIQKVYSTRPDDPKVTELAPYFSYDHENITNKNTCYWHARALPALQNLPGTRTLISFVDLDFSLKQPAEEVVYARTLCTNRGLAAHIPAGGVLSPEKAIPVKEITCLHQPTPSVYSSRDGADQWKLISQLSLGYLSLSNAPESLKAFREVLTLYGGAIQETIATSLPEITALETTPIVRRIGQDAWRGMVRGTGVTLTLGEQSFKRKEALLFSKVLSHFCNLYCNINSFVELSIKRPDEQTLWKTWPPQIGIHTLF